jgi:hypothetical protein
MDLPPVGSAVCPAGTSSGGCHLHAVRELTEAPSASGQDMGPACPPPDRRYLHDGDRPIHGQAACRHYRTVRRYPNDTRQPAVYPGR